jgi:amino acid transporter
VKDAGRSIPRAMLSSVVTIAFLYILINLAFLAVVSLPTIAGSNTRGAAWSCSISSARAATTILRVRW